MMKQKVYVLLVALATLTLFSSCNQECEPEQQKTTEATRYIGKVSSDKKIMPIYLPVLTDELAKDENRASLRKANEQYGWTFFKDDTEEDHRMLTMQAPRNDTGYTDSRLIERLFYHYKKGDVYFDCWSKPIFKKDIVKAAHEGSAEDIKLLKDILTLYGFTEQLKASAFKKSGQLNFEGYNMTQFPEGPMWGSIYCTQLQESVYYLEMQVVQKSPK